MADKKNTPQLNLRDKAEALLRRRWLIVIPIVACFGISVAVGFFLSPTYEASAVIQVNEKKIVDPIVEGLAVPKPIKDQIEGLGKELKSWPQLMLIVDQFHMADRLKSPRELEEFVIALRKRITIEARGNNLIQVAFKDPDPALAQNVANAVAQNFINLNAQLGKEEARNAINFISDQLKVYKKKLEDSEKNFSTHKINSDLRIGRNKLRLLQNQLANLQKIIPSQVKTEYSPVFARLQAHLAELEIERARLMLDATPENPRVKELNDEIAQIKAQLNEEIKKEMVRESVSMMNPSYVQVEQELKQVEMEVDYLEKRKKELESADGGKTKDITEEELSTLETNKKVDEDIYQMLLKQMESAYVSEQLQDTDKGARLRIIEYARLPVDPMKPLRTNVMLIGLFSGALIGFGLAFGVEQVDRSFRTVEDAKSSLQIPVMGAISKIIVKENEKKSAFGELAEHLRKYVQRYRVLSDMRFISPYLAKRSPHSNIAPQVVIYHDPKCGVAEEYRILRTNLHGIKSDVPLKTLMVTSAVRGEGKSTTTMNLAIAIADTGKNVLLIDGDLRRGSVHRLLDIRQGPGLTHLISNSVSVESALVKSEIKNLTVLPCGTKPVRPSELLGSGRMENLLEKFRTLYDVVLLDAPPVLNLPDTCVLSKFADGVVFVVQAERTQREEVTRAHAMLQQSNARVLGFVLTNVRYYIPKYLYDYYYGDYDS